MPSANTAWLDVQRAAAHVGISAPTILRAARRGDLRAFKVGGRKLWRFRVEDMLEAIRRIASYTRGMSLAEFRVDEKQ